VIAAGEWAGAALDWSPLLAAFVLVSGYVFGSWRRGLSDTWKETVDAQSAELKVYESANARMVKESVECKEAIARLHGVVDQLRNENIELRKLVMMENVPPAMAEMTAANTRVAMEMAAEQRAVEKAALVAEFTELLHPIAQGVARLLTERGGEAT